VLVLIGPTEDGTKELIAVVDGYRQSSQSWRELLQQLKRLGAFYRAQAGFLAFPHGRDLLRCGSQHPSLYPLFFTAPRPSKAAVSGKGEPLRFQS
jgi:hypothetical protein